MDICAVFEEIPSMHSLAVHFPKQDRRTERVETQCYIRNDCGEKSWEVIHVTHAWNCLNVV